MVFAGLASHLHARCSPTALVTVLATFSLTGWHLGRAQVIDECRYQDDATARSAWRAVGGTAPARCTTVEGQPALLLRCNFSSGASERAVWDRSVSLDLSDSAGIEFKLFCRNSAPVSHFTLYFQSGAGWYTVPFSVEADGRWNRVFVDKADSTMEGRPAGWRSLRTIRLAAWRGSSEETEIVIRDVRKVGRLGSDRQVVVLRSESLALAQPGETRSVQNYTLGVVRFLSAAGIHSVMVSDLDLSLDGLLNAALLILPYNPDLSDVVVNVLLKYVAQGGKLLVFYTLDSRLSPYVGIERGKYVKADQPGRFSTIRVLPQSLVGTPPRVGQNSWNIMEYKPSQATARVLAEWLDQAGKPTGYPAIVGSSNCIVMSHVLLPDDAFNKQRLVRAMLGALVPAIWEAVARHSIESLGQIGPYRGFAEAVNEMEANSGSGSSVRRELEAAKRLRDSALAQVAKGRFVEACADADEAGRRLLTAYAVFQRPLKGEFRAFWCHNALGVEGLTWEEVAARLAQNGFAAVFPNMCWGGVAYYRSRVLPEAAEVGVRGDQLAECVKACRRRGVQVHVWKVNWNLGSAAPPNFVQSLRRDNRLQMNSKGEERLWLCPSHPLNRALELEAMLEIVRNYDVDGIHFDYIRYPDGDHCFCNGCRERFQQETNRKVLRWPLDVSPGGVHRQVWLDWRRQNITALVRAVSERTRALKPGIKLSAAVFPNWERDRDTVGQDWHEWCERGYLDFVCPMDYTSSSQQFANWVTRQKQWAGKTPCFPGIGASAAGSGLPVDKVIDQILTTRKCGTGGFIIFELNRLGIQDILPILGMGITAQN
ncbi:MAG: family 10 glycosylhydrolase [Kiritimatiellae bacterium]|nr:family 10 glycosylhydrolase [Kiritimatiellia bacterium]